MPKFIVRGFLEHTELHPLSKTGIDRALAEGYTKDQIIPRLIKGLEYQTENDPNVKMPDEELRRYIDPDTVFPKQFVESKILEFQLIVTMANEDQKHKLQIIKEEGFDAYYALLTDDHPDICKLVDKSFYFIRD